MGKVIPFFNTKNQKGNQVNIPTVRTKTSGSNSIKSKYVNTWNDLKLFIKKQLVNQKRIYCKSLIKSYFSSERITPKEGDEAKEQYFKFFLSIFCVSHGQSAIERDSKPIKNMM